MIEKNRIFQGEGNKGKGMGQGMADKFSFNWILNHLNNIIIVPYRMAEDNMATKY